MINLYVLLLAGRGFYGVVIPGCPETFQSPQEESGDRMRDRHQKVQNFEKGDMLVIPAGVAHWFYNNGDQDLKVIVMFDTTNSANQLDSIPQVLYRFVKLILQHISIDLLLINHTN